MNSVTVAVATIISTCRPISRTAHAPNAAATASLSPRRSRKACGSRSPVRSTGCTALSIHSAICGDPRNERNRTLHLACWRTHEETPRTGRPPARKLGDLVVGRVGVKSRCAGVLVHAHKGITDDMGDGRVDPGLRRISWSLTVIQASIHQMPSGSPRRRLGSRSPDHADS